MAITIVGTSTPAENATGALTVALPTGWKPGDNLYVWFFSRVTQTPVPKPGWTQLFLVAASNRRLAAYHKRAEAGETAFTVTAGSGVCAGAMTALRSTRDGYEIADVTATAPAYTASGVQNIGAITRPTATPTPAVGAVVYLGAKIGAWTTVDTLTGDSLSWTELVDYPTLTGNDMGLVVDIATWTTAPTLTNKTFTVTGGAAADAAGKGLILGEVALPRTNPRRTAAPLALALSCPLSRPLAA